MKLRLSYVILISALTLALVFDALFYNASDFSINILLAEIAFLGVTIWLAHSQSASGRITLPTAAKITALFALAFSATFAIWTESWSLSMCLIGFFVSNILFCIAMLGEATRFRHPYDVLGHLFLTPIKHAVYALPFARTLMPEKFSTRTQAIIKSSIIALPILFTFAIIFISADAVIRSYIINAFDALNNIFSVPNVIGHIFFVGCFLVLFSLFFAATFWRRKIFDRKTIDNSACAVLESKVILLSVVALFGVFIIVSGATLFGGSAAFANLDITYAEYAKQGFGQLCAAATLAIGLIMTLRVLHTETLIDKKLLLLQMTLLVEACVVLISAFMRLGMYIGAYGYTPARLFGLWFFTLITVYLALTFVNIIERKHQSVLVMQMLVVAGVAILTFTALSPDTLSIRLNATYPNTNIHSPLR